MEGAKFVAHDDFLSVSALKVAYWKVACSCGRSLLRIPAPRLAKASSQLKPQPVVQIVVVCGSDMVVVVLT